PHLHPSVRRRIITEADGNPLALLELPLALTEGQETGRESLPESIPPTDRLRRLLAARVEQLPASTRAMLLLAALDGQGGAPPGRVIDDARRGDTIASGVNALVMPASAVYFEGRWAEAASTADEAIALCAVRAFTANIDALA